MEGSLDGARKFFFGSSLFCVGKLNSVIGKGIYRIDDSCCVTVNSMERKSQQGQALRVLASSHPCSLSLSMLYLEVAKARGLYASGGALAQGLSLSGVGLQGYPALPTRNSEEALFSIVTKFSWIL